MFLALFIENGIFVYLTLNWLFDLEDNIEL